MNNEVMTPLEFERKMMDIIVLHRDNPDCAHADADELMSEVLKSLGYDRGVHMFEELDKYYV